MTVREFLTSVSIILIVMAVGACLEILVPMFADKPWRRGRRGANLLTIYDRLLATYTPGERAASVVYGLDGAEQMGRASLPRVMMPFRRRRTAAFDTATYSGPAGLRSS